MIKACLSLRVMCKQTPEGDAGPATAGILPLKFYVLSHKSIHVCGEATNVSNWRAMEEEGL